ncbi:MAG: hypothetical protein ACRD4G_06275, partial [Bryobacteraceae bacterium]
LNEIREASRLKGRYPISYADAFAAGLAMKYSTRLTTGDPEFRALERLRLNWIGAKGTATAGRLPTIPDR